INLDDSPQARAAVDDHTVEEYAVAMSEPGGADGFPAVTLFEDTDSILRVGDGWHRIQAALKAGLTTIRAEVRPGTRRDGLRYALSANNKHGRRPTREDKRRAVELALADEEWAKWSDRAISRLCGVSNTFVGEVRASLTVNVDSEDAGPRTYRTKHGS